MGTASRCGPRRRAKQAKLSQAEPAAPLRHLFDRDDGADAGDQRQGGTKRSPLPDFVIGAHAAVSGYRLVTRDAARYRSDFLKVGGDRAGWRDSRAAAARFGQSPD
jgi:predicted nucleic acid-binding protein